VQAPGQVTGLVATPGSRSVTLRWVAPAATGGAPITGYIVLVGRNSRQVSGTSTTITGLTPGATHVFRVRAVNGAGLQSNPMALPSVTVVPLR
jgi:hypothetical protein